MAWYDFLRPRPRQTAPASPYGVVGPDGGMFTGASVMASPGPRVAPQSSFGDTGAYPNIFHQLPDQPQGPNIFHPLPGGSVGSDQPQGVAYGGTVPLPSMATAPSMPAPDMGPNIFHPLPSGAPQPGPNIFDPLPPQAQQSMTGQPVWNNAAQPMAGRSSSISLPTSNAIGGSFNA